VTDYDQARCRAIELLVLDVDGVLTDGVIAVDDHGVETKHFHVRDGAGLTAWRRLGKRAAILSGRSARAVEHRAADLSIAPVLQGVERKSGAFRSLLKELGLEPGQACYMGDDLADLGPLRLAGLAACPADAAAEVRDVAHLVTTAPGGRGAVREVIEAILGAQGVWESLVAEAGDDP
jgi:3-deoxy-D-manno-octulosonate 8-phosphate phosphatase (KDO 8-P phosphatase)